MSEPVILFVKPGEIKPNDKGLLRKAGVLVVEVQDPNAVNLVRARSLPPVDELPPGELLAAFAAAIAGDSNGYVKTAFATALAKAVVARHGKAS